MVALGAASFSAATRFRATTTDLLVDGQARGDAAVQPLFHWLLLGGLRVLRPGLGLRTLATRILSHARPERPGSLCLARDCQRRPPRLRSARFALVVGALDLRHLCRHHLHVRPAFGKARSLHTNVIGASCSTNPTYYA